MVFNLLLSRVLGVAQSAPDDYISGYTKDAVMRDELDPDVMVREKPFSHEQLAAKVREMLDGK